MGFTSWKPMPCYLRQLQLLIFLWSDHGLLKNLFNCCYYAFWGLLYLDSCSRTSLWKNNTFFSISFSSQFIYICSCADRKSLFPSGTHFIYMFRRATVSLFFFFIFYFSRSAKESSYIHFIYICSYISSYIPFIYICFEFEELELFPML